jgi:RHS repeat-associated protein
LTRVDKKSNGTDIDLTVEYRYEAWGNRIEKSVDLDGPGIGNPTVTKFLLDGDTVRADLANDGSLNTQYLRDDRIDGLQARIDMTGSNQGQYWYLTDHLGSIRNVVDASGAVVDSLVYDAFGNITSETDPTYRGMYAWTGREIEVEVDLQFNRARFYDPSIGRWISKDPLGFAAGDSNLYRYVNNSPTNHVDPSGLWTLVAENTYSRGKDDLKGAYETARITVKLETEWNGHDFSARINYRALAPKRTLTGFQMAGWKLVSTKNNYKDFPFSVPGDAFVELGRAKLDNPNYYAEGTATFSLGTISWPCKGKNTWQGRLAFQHGQIDVDQAHSRQAINWSMTFSGFPEFKLSSSLGLAEEIAGSDPTMPPPFQMLRLIHSVTIPRSGWESPFPTREEYDKSMNK